MSAFRKAMLGLAAVAAFAVPALAQNMVDYGGVLLLYPNGKMTVSPIDKSSMDMAMKHAKPVTNPMMIVMSGGKTYVVENMNDKMPDGKRMIDYFEQMTYGNH